MQYLQIKDWDKMQHYKKRNPPWIKLYAEILDDENFEFLSDHCKLIYLCMLPFASRKSNKMRNDPRWLSRKLPIDAEITSNHVLELLKAGFLFECNADSTMLALRYPDATPETEERQSKVEESIKETPSNIFTLQQVENAGFKAGVSDDECKMFYDHYNSQGWLKGNGLPITELVSQLTNWRNNGHKFDRPKAEPKKEDQQAAQWEQRFGDVIRGYQADVVMIRFEGNLRNPDFRDWIITIKPEMEVLL